MRYGYLLGWVLALTAGFTVVFSDASLAAREVEEEGDEVESPSAIPSWRSFDQWLNRSGLKLSDDQLKKLEALRKEVDPAEKPASEKSDVGSEVSDAPAISFEQQKGSWQQYQAGLAKILTPEQQQKLKKQWYQFRGFTVLGDDEVAAKLKLTEEQRKQVDDSLETFKTRRHEIVQETKKTGKTGRQRRRAVIAELRTTRDKRLEGVMTPEQKKAFEKLGDPEEDGGALLPAPKLSDDFIELGPATKNPPRGGSE